jgi:hypothetical protein
MWLVSQLEECLATFETHPEDGYRIWILGGWYGVTNFILRSRSIIPVEHVHSIDIDPSCQPVADKINKFWEWQNWQFKAHTADANKLSYIVEKHPHVVINSSVEHFDSREWWDRIPNSTLVVLQGCDLEHDEHVHAYPDLEAFKADWPVKEIMYEGSMTFNYPTHEFTRFMIIAIK